MITKYRTTHLHPTTIDAVECVRDTESCVFLYHEQWAHTLIQKMKLGQREQYHPTWQDAHEFLVKQADAAVSKARGAMIAANTICQEVEAMKPPEVAK